jgi:NAD-dependent SIR2 family protein deacetylase
MSEELDRARRVIADADAMLIAAGAGMGVDSGLPDFRGPEGFWRAYPALRGLGLQFEEIANPQWFRRDPALAWGFYGHRLNLYRRTQPHEGFEILRRWGSAKRSGYFVFTSNVDGHFQTAEFDADRIVECHGSIHHAQCLESCGNHIWENDAEVRVDEATMRAADPLPRCPHCGGPARPNVLMFGDAGWAAGRTNAQVARMRRWLDEIEGKRLVIIECGAGTAVATVRLNSERMLRSWPRGGGATLIRINPREPNVPAGQIPIAAGSLAALRAIDALT